MKKYEIGFGADALVYPKSVAVIGVSGNAAKKNVAGGTAVLNNLVRFGYTGNIYPINPKYDTVAGLKSYPSISDVPEKVDLVVVAVAATGVAATLEECGKAGCRCAMIISSGFAELKTEEGEAMQREIVAIGEKYNMRLVGPNNLGSYNVLDNMIASSSATLLHYEQLRTGSIAWVSQSGAMCSSMYARADDEGIGIPCVITTGNECDLEGADFAWLLLDDPRINVLCIYCEEIKDREKFAAVAKKAKELRKPVLVFKNGRSAQGSAACKAHTASNAGELKEYEAFFEEIGVISVDSLDEFYGTANLLNFWHKYDDVQNFAVISTSGGSGICLTDCLCNNGMNVPLLSPELKAKVMELVPSFGSAANPIDATAHLLRTPEKFGELGELLQQSDEVDAIVLAPTTMGDEAAVSTAQDFAKLIANSTKPMVVHWYCGQTNANAAKILRDQGIPVFTSYEAFARAMKHRKDYFRYLNRAD